MSTVGIIAEYNPLHNGHLYHLKQAKLTSNSKYCLVVMSPNFVQRGQIALLDKWSRTKTALLAGADLVIELPTIYANSSAEAFASYGVSLLNASGIVDSLCFGSESTNLNLQRKLADILVDEPQQFKDSLRFFLDKGLSFPAARSQALLEYSKTLKCLSNLSDDITSIMSSPNNILSIEYLKALSRLKSPINPISIERLGSNYHSESIEDHFSSATAIRKNIVAGKWNKVEDLLPSYSYSLLQANLSSYSQKKQLSILFDYISYRLLFSSPSSLKNIVGATEGLENRVLTMFKISSNYNEFVQNIKTKRFTQTSIQRLLINILLQINKSDYNKLDSLSPPYIRVLGFRRKSSHLISKMKVRSKSPLVLNVKEDYSKISSQGKFILDKEIQSTNIYSRITDYSFKSMNYNLDLSHPLVII